MPPPNSEAQGATLASLSSDTTRGALLLLLHYSLDYHSPPAGGTQPIHRHPRVVREDGQAPLGLLRRARRRRLAARRRARVGPELGRRGALCGRPPRQPSRQAGRARARQRLPERRRERLTAAFGFWAGRGAGGGFWPWPPGRGRLASRRARAPGLPARRTRHLQPPLPEAFANAPALPLPDGSRVGALFSSVTPPTLPFHRSLHPSLPPLPPPFPSTAPSNLPFRHSLRPLTIALGTDAGRALRRTARSSQRGSTTPSSPRASRLPLTARSCASPRARGT